MLSAEQSLGNKRHEHIYSLFCFGIVHKFAEYGVFVCGKRQLCRGREVYICGELNVARGLAEHYLISARGRVPVAECFVVIAEAALCQRKAYVLALSRLKQYLFKALKLLHGAHIKAGAVCNIKLYRFFTRTAAGVCDNSRDGYCIVIRNICFRHLYIRIFKGRVGQAVTERIKHLRLLFVIVSVAYKHALVVLGVPVAGVGEIARRVGQLSRE